MLGSLWFNSFSSGGGAAAYELISTTAGTGSSNTISFTSIPAGYKHLQIRAVARSTAAADYTGFTMRFNSDTAANYSAHFLYGNSASVQSSANTSLGFMYMGWIVGANKATNHNNSYVVDILDPFATTKNKTIRALGGFADGAVSLVNLNSGAWYSTAAVTSIQLSMDAGNFTTTSRFSLYGIRGS